MANDFQRKLKRHLDASDRDIEAFAASITAFLRQNLARILSDVSVDDQARAFGILRDLIPSLQSAGLVDEAARLEMLYGKELAFVGSMVAGAAGGRITLSAADADIIETLIALDVESLQARVTSYVVDLRAQVMRGVVGGLAPDIDGILGEALPRLERTLKTEIDTSKAMFSRAVNIKKSSDAGLNYFVYRGPDDKVTRPFCQSRVGKVFHRRELESWDNGQGIPASTSLGGYNCRHYPDWITDERARQLGY